MPAWRAAQDASETPLTQETNLSFVARWRIYFSERFPPLQHGTLIAAFVLGAMAYSARLQGHTGFPGLAPILCAFVVTFLFFLQLRILDEFKDFEDDARWRPYRPVPRGLVTLRALGWLWVIAAMVQLALSAMFTRSLVLMLIAIWAYSGLMGVEFFVRDWLKARPVAYMASHMVIVPMIALFITAFDWLPNDHWDGRLGWLLATSYFGFCVIEIGRKVRAPEDEEEGVETYSALWGRRNSVIAWLAVMALTGVLAVAASRLVGTPLITLAYVLIFFATSLGVAVGFLRNPLPGRGKRLQLLSGLWTLGIFLVPGLVPWLLPPGTAA
jgi:4-hydroxybenzoate polyprenyltransferase